MPQLLELEHAAVAVDELRPAPRLSQVRGRLGQADETVELCDDLDGGEPDRVVLREPGEESAPDLLHDLGVRLLCFLQFSDERAQLGAVVAFDLLRRRHLVPVFRDVFDFGRHLQLVDLLAVVPIHDRRRPEIATVLLEQAVEAGEDLLDPILTLVEVGLDAALRHEEAVVLRLDAVERRLPAIQRRTQVRHRRDQLSDHAVPGAHVRERAHGEVDLLEAFENPQEVLRLAAPGVDPGRHPLKVGEPRELRREAIENGGVGVERVDGIQPRIDPIRIHKRMAHPLPEHTLTKRCDASVEQRAQRSGHASINSVGENLGNVRQDGCQQGKGLVRTSRLINV